MYVEEKRGYKIGEGGKKKGILRVLDDVFVQLKLDHAGGACTCMWNVEVCGRILSTEVT